MDKTKDNKEYISNDVKYNYTFCRLKLFVGTTLLNSLEPTNECI